MSSLAGIDDLPIEMIGELFRHLNLKDLAACSMVNKSWHSAYSACKLQRLFTSEEFSRFHLSQWCHSNREVKAEELCQLKMFSCWAEKPLLANLKHLALGGESLRFDLNKLNGLRQLVHLEINLKDLGEERKNLNLPKLNFLAFYQFNQYCPLSVDCPELIELVYDGEYYGDYYGESADDNLLDVKHPETIRKLHTDLFGTKLAPFKNVECLVTHEFINISKAILLTLPKLKELHYKARIERVFWSFQNEALGRVDQMKRTLREFLDDVKLFRGNDFKFRFAGFPLNKATLNALDVPVEIHHLRRETVPDEHLYMTNHQLIDPDDTLEWIDELDYTLLMKSNGAEAVPMCFFSKFTGVEQVVVNGPIQDANHLLGFLKSLSLLKILSLNCLQIGQEFYDQLPASARSLTDLILRENKIQLNFDFISEFPHLLRLPMNHSIDQSSFQSFTSLVRHFGKLKSGFFYFRLNEKTFFVQKICGSKMCEVSHNYLTVFETDKPDEIVNFFRLKAVEESE